MGAVESTAASAGPPTAAPSAPARNVRRSISDPPENQESGVRSLNIRAGKTVPFWHKPLVNLEVRLLGLLVAETPVEVADELFRGLGDDGAGGEDRRNAGVQEGVPVPL